MDRGAWWATYSSWGRKRVRHDLVTKQQQQKQSITPASVMLTMVGNRGRADSNSLWCLCNFSINKNLFQNLKKAY